MRAVHQFMDCVEMSQCTPINHQLFKSKGRKMRVLYVNNDGGGFADYVEVSPGMTVEIFFNEKMPNRKPDDFLIRVNRQPVARDYVLQEGDRVTVTPTKIEGALV